MPYSVSSSHVIFIDEAGHGAPINDKNRFWICCAVSIPGSALSAMETGVSQILEAHFHPERQRPQELKGSYVPKNLKMGSSSGDVSRGVSDLLADCGANVWIAATEAGVRPPRNMSFLQDGSPKEIARQLLFERVNGFLDARPFAKSTFQTIWDLSDHTDHADFSRSVQTFRNAVSGRERNTRLADNVIGKASHEVPGLQIADFLANYALHRVAMDFHVPTYSQEKAAHFDLYFSHRLRRDAQGKVVGWKVYCPGRG